MATLMEESLDLARKKYGQSNIRLLGGGRAFLITTIRSGSMSTTQQERPLMVVIDSEMDMEEVKQTFPPMGVFVEGYGGEIECVEDFAFLEHMRS